MPVTDKTRFFSFTNSFLFVKRDFCARGGQIFNRLGNENYSDLEVRGCHQVGLPSFQMWKIKGGRPENGLAVPKTR